MNGITFANLPQLVKLDVSWNDCIHKTFIIERGSTKFRRKISRRCTSADVARKQLSCRPSAACDERLYAPNCCELEDGTFIDRPDFTFAFDANYIEIELLIIAHQQNVDFLPVSVHERFPNLRNYYVTNTAVPIVSKKNFEKMSKLESLGLDRNQIEVIRSDTFEDLVNVEWIEISKRMLRFFILFCNRSRIHSKPTTDCFKFPSFC